MELQAITAQNEEVEREYIKYSTAYETPDESILRDNRDLIDKSRDLVDPYGFITMMNIADNHLKLTIFSPNIGKVTDSLNQDPDKWVEAVVPISESKQDRQALDENAISTSMFDLLFTPKEVEK